MAVFRIEKTRDYLYIRKKIGVAQGAMPIDLRKRQTSRFDKRPSGVSEARKARRG